MPSEDLKYVNRRSIGATENCYGGVMVAEKDGTFFWAIECMVMRPAWEEIPESLYRELIKFEEERERD